MFTSLWFLVAVLGHGIKTSSTVAHALSPTFVMVWVHSYHIERTTVEFFFVFDQEHIWSWDFLNFNQFRNMVPECWRKLLQKGGR